MPWNIILPFFFVGLLMGINNAKAYYKSKKSTTHADSDDF